jgi:pimeloyl-ACP methyl ester carboxylesterase
MLLNRENRSIKNLFRILKLAIVFVILNNRAFSQKQVHSDDTIRIGGIRQYIQIRGKDASKPILLLLHGGPGGSLMNKTEKITGKLQTQFIIVQWDQRETGRTLGLNKSPKPLTLEMFYNDTHDLIDSLLKKFQKPKLFLAGYSWGTGMGFHIADKYPEKLYAYIAISPVINSWKSDSISLAMLRETMGKNARNDLSQVKIPFENAEQLYYHRKWLLKHEGQKFVDITFRKSFVEGWAATWFDVWRRSCDINLFQTLPTINCPVYFFAGKNDYNTNASITQEYYNKLKAPKKNLFLFTYAGHGLPESDSDAFQEIILRRILPEAFY